MIANMDLVEYQSDDVDFAILIESVSANTTLNREWDRYVSLFVI
jgi:hypothetical protein